MRGAEVPFPAIAWVATRSRVSPSLLQNSSHPSLRNGRYYPSLRSEQEASIQKLTCSLQAVTQQGSLSPAATTSSSSSPHSVEEDDVSVLSLQKAISSQNSAAASSTQVEQPRPFTDLVVKLAATARRGEKRPHIPEDPATDDEPDVQVRAAKRKRID